jgi:N-acetylglucosamine-6-phosphate deacetylase
MRRKPESIHLRGTYPGAAHPCDLEIRGGMVTRMTRAGKAAVDFGSREVILAPPLFDAQVNGVCGIGLQGAEVRPEDFRLITTHLARQGVARWIPTLVTGPLDALEHGCRVLAEALHDPVVARAVPGAHLEGPWISPEDGPRGAHPRLHVRPPDLREFDRLQKAASGQVLYVTLAPELPGALPFIRGLAKRGVLVSLGHHAAPSEVIAAAVKAGARLCTHLGNGAASLMHRHYNPLWPQLAEDRLTASLIADLHHLPPPVLKTFVRAKGPERILLVSDCTRLAGLKPGKYFEFGAEVELKANGRLCLSGTDLLAGSALKLIDGVINAWQHTDLDLAQAFACASTLPARFFGVKPPAWPPRAGRKANLLLLELEKSRGHVRPALKKVFIDGYDIA